MRSLLRSLFVTCLLAPALAACSSSHGKDAGLGAKRDAAASQTGHAADAAQSQSVRADDLDAGHERDAGSGADASSTAMPVQKPRPGSCTNGLEDGTETDIDCGGPDCGSCLSGRHCNAGSDCASGECTDGACTCVASRSCPKDACGTVRACGAELDCGSCASGVCYENQCCTPRVCAKGECGVFADGCGGAIRCGDQSCCTPRSCDHPSLANRCGDFDDRCGGKVSCTCADSKATCYLAECCSPPQCDGDACGIVVASCGASASCGCATSKTCYQGHCCQPVDCSAWVGPGCAEIDDGCGGKLSCGCTQGQSCRSGSCCTAVTCGTGAAGDACGTSISDGCGGTLSCACTGSLSCFQTKCCASKTCAEQNLQQRCGPNTDSCGTSSWCGCGTTGAMHVAQRNACTNACADTLDKVRTCDASAALETLDQTAGWDFPQALSSSICTASYGFSPNWTNCHNGFALDAQGFVYLDVGTQCFSITGRKLNSCGSLYFVATPDTFTGWDNLPGTTAATLVSGHAPVCFSITKADYYPIRWHYTQDAGLEDFHVNYCAGGPTGCVPIPSSMLRPALP